VEAKNSGVSEEKCAFFGGELQAKGLEPTTESQRAQRKSEKCY
jgi:hypothetical protein